MRKIKLIWALVTIIPIVLILLGYLFPSEFFSNQERIRDFVGQFGVFAPIAFILLQITQVVLTPISHYVVSLAGGFIFGTWLGGIYNWIGRVVGTFIAFYLGRKFGRRIIERFVSFDTLKKYDKIFEKGKFLLFLMYFLPLFPDDELSYLAGFSSMKTKAFIPIMVLGHFGGSFALAYVGSGIPATDPIFLSLVTLSLALGALFIFFYKRFQKLI